MLTANTHGAGGGHGVGREVVAPETCPMCGHADTGDATESGMRPAITGLAELADDHPVAVLVMLLRVCHPHATQEYLAQRLRRERTTITMAVTRLAKARPDLRGALGMRGCGHKAAK
jgi:hypothetical protein